jgi:hypothetical protein
LRSPEVNADRTITIRLRAAYATSVTASGDFGDLTLTKDKHNIWSVTTFIGFAVFGRRRSAASVSQ